MGEIEESKRVPTTGAGMSELARIPTHIEGLDENMQEASLKGTFVSLLVLLEQ